MIARFIRRIFRLQPYGYTLRKADGGIDGGIRGDLVPAGTLVIVDRGRRFVRTGQTDSSGFEIYAEGHKTFEYVSAGG
ncbi:MAG TPA: hypothetical protein VGN60_09125 [Devosia sp.]|jgi:hypothetical protein|nr:hypothetical protein [Devosia sp.]